MSGFDSRKYKFASGMHDSPLEASELIVFGRELDPESRFARDLGAFCRINYELYKRAAADLVTEAPEGFKFITKTAITSNHSSPNVDVRFLDALNFGHLKYMAMKRIGYQVLAVVEKGEHDKEVCSDSMIGVYQKTDEPKSYPYSIKDGRIGLPYLITTNTFSYSLEQGFPGSWHESPLVNGWKSTGMLERGFMTGTLLHAKRCLAEGDNKKFGNELMAYLDLYNKLVDEGYTPLGPEELAGITEASIRDLEP